jgi:hypothetical protein
MKLFKRKHVDVGWEWIFKSMNNELCNYFKHFNQHKNIIMKILLSPSISILARYSSEV